MRTLTRNPLIHVVGIVAVVCSAILAVVVSPLWLIAAAALSIINLVRYAEPVWRTGVIELRTLPLMFLNLVILTGAIAYALFSLKS